VAANDAWKNFCDHPWSAGWQEICHPSNSNVYERKSFFRAFALPFAYLTYVYSYA